MNFSALNPFRRKPKETFSEFEGELSDAQINLLREIQAKLSGLGETPNFGYRVNLADIQKAIRLAEVSGMTWYLFGLFRDMEENDPHLQAEMGKRIMSFMGQEEKIEPVDKDNKDDVIAKEVIEDMITNCENWREGSIHLAQGHIWPIAGAEKIFSEVKAGDGTQWRHPVMHRLKTLHPIPWPLFTYQVAYWNAGINGGMDMDGFQGFASSSGAIPINNPAGNMAYKPTGTESKDSVLIWNPQDWHPDLRFYGTLENGVPDFSLSNGYKPERMRHVLHSAQVATSGIRDNFGATMRALIPIWFYKKNLLDWYMQKMERYGGPFAVTQANMANKNLTDTLKKSFEQSAVLNALLVPPGTKVELKEVNVSGMSDGFAKGIEVLNTEMTKAILGQTLSTSSKGSGMMGGSGVADLHGEVRAEWAVFDKRTYCDMQRQQIFTPFLRINGYKGNCRSTRGGMTPANLAVTAQSLQRLAQAGIFPDPEAQAELSSAVGYKMRIVDMQKAQLEMKRATKPDQGGDSSEAI